MDIHTLRVAIDKLNETITRSADYPLKGHQEWSEGVVAGLVAARNEMEYMLQLEFLYRDSEETV